MTVAESQRDPDDSGQRDELDRLRKQNESDAAVLALFGRVDRSHTGTGSCEAIRDRYERNLHRTAVLLEQFLSCSETAVRELKEENRTLRKTNRRLKYKLDRTRLQLRDALGIKTVTRDGDKREDTVCPGDTDGETKNGRKGGRRRGAPGGHRGRTRNIPERVDRTEIIAPAEVCSCGSSNITALSDYDMRYIEDIPRISKEVIGRIYMQGRCRDCGKIVRRPDAVHGPPVVTGPNLAAHLTMLNHMGMTFRKLSALSTRTFGLELSPSGALGIINRVTASLEGPYEEILAALPRQPWLNGDETGWKVMGRRGYIWGFFNEDLAFFHHDYRRSAKVIEEILTDRFSGIVICDFYAAYNCIDRTQRCLVHLLRDIKKEREILSGSKLLKRFDKAVRRFIEKGLEVQAMPEGEAKNRALAKVEKQLDKLTRMPVTGGKATTLVKRIDKYRDHLIRFVTHPGVEFHNNRAERRLRPIVINRKVSFGSNTDHGARRYCIIHTIVETCKLQNIDPIDFIRRAYVSGGLDVPSLTGADPPVAA